jgi:sec-independent protein translocase protein TatA
MRPPSGIELVIILVIILLLFGVGRVSKVGKELGSAITEFRKGLSEGKETQETSETTIEKKS